MKEQLQAAVHWYNDTEWYWIVLIGGIIGACAWVLIKLLLNNLCGDINYFEYTHTSIKDNQKSIVEAEEKLRRAKQ